jgi:hypothetical protein
VSVYVSCFLRLCRFDVRRWLCPAEKSYLTFRGYAPCSGVAAQKILEKSLSESQRLSAHQAAKPQSKTHAKQIRLILINVREFKMSFVV